MVEKMENIQQQFGKRNTCIPTNTSLVCSSMVLSLKKEVTLSEQNLKTFSNNIEENQLSCKTERTTSVFVINLRKQPLMPTTPRNARKLLQQKKAKVVSCKPFTIQLLQATGETKQEITLGIDSGYKKIGFSAITKKQELISGELKLRTNVSDKLTERAMYRRNKRNKLWYRQPRFMNRVSSKKKGWLPPSVKHKVESHIRLVNKIKTFLPITKTIIEVAKFDAQKLQNVDIEGVEYQQGQMKGYDNLRAFVLQRDNYTCQICKKKEGIFDVHHIIQRKDGGSNRPDNLSTLHIKCHKDFHSGKIKHIFNKTKSFKQTVIMNNIRKYIVDKIGCNYTFGYITKRKRLELGLDKTHYNDAFVIASGTTQIRSKILLSKQIRRNNRCLQINRKGFKPSIRRKRYNIQSNDVVQYQGRKLIVKGMFNYGKWIRMVDNFGNIINSNVKNVEVKYYGKGIQI